jgi:hypothetical protein
MRLVMMKSVLGTGSDRWAYDGKQQQHGIPVLLDDKLQRRAGHMEDGGMETHDECPGRRSWPTS